MVQGLLSLIAEMERFVYHFALQRALTSPISFYPLAHHALSAPSFDQAATLAKNPTADGSKWSFEQDRRCRILTEWSPPHVS
jgi:hypothetical protein